MAEECKERIHMPNEKLAEQTKEGKRKFLRNGPTALAQKRKSNNNYVTQPVKF